MKALFYFFVLVTLTSCEQKGVFPATPTSSTAPSSSCVVLSKCLVGSWRIRSGVVPFSAQIIFNEDGTGIVNNEFFDELISTLRLNVRDFIWSTSDPDRLKLIWQNKPILNADPDEEVVGLQLKVTERSMTGMTMRAGLSSFGLDNQTLNIGR